MARRAGGFGTAFSQAFAAMMNAVETQRHNKAMEDHYARMDANAAGKGFPTDIFNAGKAGASPYQGGASSGGSASVSKNLGANQQEAYGAAIKEGLSDGAARALVANMSGEALADPSNVHKDGPHMAHGIVQWDDVRTAAIEKQFGKPPQNMSVADQTKAAIWEMKTNPLYKQSWDVLNSGASPQDMVKTLVRNYERPGNPEVSINQRLQHLGNLPTNMDAGATTAGKVAQTGATAPTTPTKGPLAGKAPKTADVASKDAQPVEASTSNQGGGFRIPGAPDDEALAAEARARADPRDQPPPREQYPAPPAVNPQDRNDDPATVREAADRAAGYAGTHPESVSSPATPSEPSTTQFARPDAPGMGGRGLPPAPGTQMGPESPLMPPDKSVYNPGTEPNTNFVRPEPPAPVQNAVRPEAPVTPVRAATINPNTDKSPVNYGPNQPGDTGARPDLVARSPATPTPTQASAASQPALPPRPTQPAQDPRFVQVTAPNSGPNDRNRPQMTALDLSSLWGANPPVAQRQAPVTPQSNPRRQDDIPPAPNDQNTAGITDEMIMGNAKGGSINRFAAGGAIPGYATAGPVSSAYPSYTPAAPAPTPGLQGNVLAATQWMNSLPGMTQVDTGNATRGYYTSYGPGSFNGQGGQQILSNYGKLTPDQVQQYNAMINGTWVPPADPTPAAPAAPAPAAPAPVAPQIAQINPTVNTLNAGTTDPYLQADTTTTGQPVTGAFKLPNTVAPKTPNFIEPDTGMSKNDAKSQGTGGTDYTVGVDDELKQNNTESAGFARGGAIPSRPGMKFAGGASVIMSPTYNGPSLGGGWTGATSYDKLAPNQQAWADTTKGILAQQSALGAADYAYWSGGGRNPEGVNGNSMQYWNQLTAMPDAVWPTAAPAAPAPLAQAAPSITQVNPTKTDPDLSADTSTVNQPVTGAFNLPNTVTPKTPNFIQPDTGESFNDPSTQNVGGTDYTVTPKGDTSQNVAQPGGFQRGGAIPKTAYDDGGGVSPTAIGGMPPGLGGGSPVPPIYYNGATYAGAGAPVGKGVTNASAGTSVAGAIPALPMVKGGAVGFDDGGSVDEASGQPLEDEGAYGAASGNARAAAPIAAQPAAVTPQSNYATAGSPQDVHPDLPAWTPQVKDADGNPSRGVIGAISGGLHYLASQLGLDGGGGQRPAMAGDPNTSVNRTSFASGQGVEGAPMPSHADVKNLHSALGTDGLTEGMRNLAGMEAVRNYYLVQGDPGKADQMSASMMQYSVSLAQQHGDEAAKRYYDGDLKGAVEQLNHASEAIADGNDYKAELAPDGKHVILSNRDLNGREVWKAKVAPQEILGAALGMKDGSLAWSAYEAQAAKYDPATAQMIRDRTMQKQQDNRQALIDQKEQNKQDAAAEAAKTEAGILTRMHQPRGITPQSNAPAPGLPPAPGAAPVLSSPSRTVVPPDQAPTSADQGAPPSPSAQGSAPSAAPPTTADQKGALPSSPGQDIQPYNVPEPEVLPNPSTDPDWSKLAPATQASVWKDYQDSVTAHRQWTTDKAKLEYEGRSAGRTQDRLDQREEFTQTQQAKTSADHDARIAAAEQEKVRLSRVSPMDERALGAKFDTNPDPTTGAVGKEPADWLAASPLYATDAQGNPVDLKVARQNMAKDFGSTGNVNRLNDALVNTQRMNSHMSTGQIADFVTGVAKGTYQFSADPKPITDAWGSRYSVAYARPDGSMGALLVPEDDMNNIIRQRQALEKQGKAAAATSAAAANPYAGPAIPPAPRRAASPTTGQESGPTVRPGMLTGKPAPESNPVGDFWQNMLHPKPMARGRGYYPPQPTQ